MKALLYALCSVLFFACPGLASDDDMAPVGQASTVVPTGPQSTRAPGSLTTIFVSDSAGGDGNMFDITTFRTLRITGLDVNAGFSGKKFTANVYWRKGTCVGFETSPAGWTLLDTGSGQAAGRDVPCFINLPGATRSFPPGTYGIYVSFDEVSGAHCYDSRGAPTTYTNSDLGIRTHCGIRHPEFSRVVYSRMWNGTIYYDDANDLPSADIKCNGWDSGLSIIHGTNARLDYDFHAGVGAGVGVDLWLVVKTPMGSFTYDGNGPLMGWNLGFGSAFHTGPLSDSTGTCLDFAPGIGVYKAFAAIETIPNGILDMGSIYASDAVDFDVVSPPRVYKWDDGTVDNLMALNNGGEICWFNAFTAYPGGETILDVHCIFGTPLLPGWAPGNGRPCRLHVWNDPTNDGDPSDAILVTTENAVVANVDLDVYTVYPLTTPAVISQDFYIGCSMVHGPIEYCMPMDQDSTYIPGASWYCGTNTPPFDANNLMNNQYPPVENFCFICIRAGY